MNLYLFITTKFFTIQIKYLEYLLLLGLIILVMPALIQVDIKRQIQLLKSDIKMNTTKIVNHYLGGSIAGYIGNPDKDQIFTLDKGATIG